MKCSATYEKQLKLKGVSVLQHSGSDHPKVLSYIDVHKNKISVGKKVAIIGAGGIGFDVAEFLTHEGESASISVDAFAREWGIDTNNSVIGGVAGIKPNIPSSAREVYLMQRKSTKHGKDLGKTTGWVHRLSLKHRNVKMIGGVTYDKVDDAGLHFTD